MNIKDYISTGVLESYVLGDVSEQERSEIEKNLQRYPELREELRKIEDAQEALLMRSAIRPGAQVKQAVMDSVSQRRTLMQRDDNVVTIARNDPARWWKFATAASVSAAIIASYMALDYKSRLNSTSRSLNDLMAQNRQMASDYNVVNQKLDTIENALRVMDNPAFRRVIMKGTENAKNALASVYWNEETNDVYLRVQNLREIAQDQQFQLWAIVDGKPVDAGTFDVSTALLKMKEISRASAFAVTIEPSGGSVSPTLETMQVMGTL